MAGSSTSGGWWGPGRYAGAAYDSSRWDGFVFRDDDVVVCAPQKCGTTWAQMICALLIFQTDQLPAPLGVLSPWLDSKTAPLAEVVAWLDAQPHRRFIKTHTPLDARPVVGSCTYLCVARDPRDVVISAYNAYLNVNVAAALEAQRAAGTLGGEALGNGVTLPTWSLSTIATSSSTSALRCGVSPMHWDHGRRRRLGEPGAGRRV
ncbi:MAG TPA: sulfotransferase domain-containing protein [Acidimicrobiales bacterium]|nr:sulfotransferase domain-containing protein [Acidimicrobiales bacterium]